MVGNYQIGLPLLNRYNNMLENQTENLDLKSIFEEETIDLTFFNEKKCSHKEKLKLKQCDFCILNTKKTKGNS